MGAVLRYCAADVPPEKLCEALAGLPLVPLSDGSVGILRACGGGGDDGPCYFICAGEAERALWAPAPSRVVAPVPDTAVMDLLASGGMQVRAW